MHAEYAQNVYREQNMPDYFADVIEHVIKRIDHGAICDLGSHAIGHYWAMGYIERVESYSCYDLSSEAIQIFKNTIRDWQPGDLQKNYAHYLNYLYKNNVIKASAEDIERQLIEKLDSIKVFDFLKDQPDKHYDIVLSNEALPVVDNYDELVIALRTAYQFLKDGGLLLSVSGPYTAETQDVQKMQSFKIEGRLNPTSEIFEKAMKDIGFRDIKTITFPIKNYENYNRLDICSARK